MYREISIEELRSGNAAIYKEVYEIYREPFLAFAKAYAIPQHDLLDIYQEAMITLYENVMQGRLIELKSSLKTYVFSIGKYKIYETLRASNRMIPVADPLSDLIDEHIEMSETLLSSKQQKLKQKFKTLGERCQNILELFYLRGMSIKEIVHFESYENENTVKAQKSRCLKQLKTIVNDK